MKNLKFISGIFSGVLVGVILLLVVSFKSETEASIPQSSMKITSLNSNTDVYRLQVDNNVYIVVVTRDGGTAIIGHK